VVNETGGEGYGRRETNGSAMDEPLGKKKKRRTRKLSCCRLSEEGNVRVRKRATSYRLGREEGGGRLEAIKKPP